MPGAPLGILEDYVGHGIGSEMHQAPDVLNYRTGHRGARVKPGMCLAIEPMLVRGDLETKVLEDDWTVVTVDGARASQWEHSVAVHMGGIWVLTAHDGGVAGLAPVRSHAVPDRAVAKRFDEWARVLEPWPIFDPGARAVVRERVMDEGAERRCVFRHTADVGQSMDSPGIERAVRSPSCPRTALEPAAASVLVWAN